MSSSEFAFVEAIFQDEDFLLFDKPAGVHYNELQCNISNLADYVPAHRIDFLTSGLLLYCRKSLFDRMRDLFATPNLVYKEYLLQTHSKVPVEISEEGLFVKGKVCSRYRSSKKVKFMSPEDSHRGYRSAQAVFHRLYLHEPAKNIYRIELISGARHQIRAYLASVNSPIIGDSLYSTAAESEFSPMRLLSNRLSFQHPLKKQKYEFKSQLKNIIFS